MMQTTYDKEKGTLYCRFAARMDNVASAAAAENLEEKLNETLGSAQTCKETGLDVIFDLEKVDYVDSAFLRLCITVAKQLDKENFSVVKCNPSVKKIFTIGGLDKIMEIY
jgi:anti-anti-sigma factor